MEANLNNDAPVIRRIRVEQLIASFAFFVSVVSLFIAYQDNRASRQLVQASSLPHLSFVSTFDRSSSGRWEKVEVALQNDGVGPADVRFAQVMLDARPISSFEELLHRCCGISEPQTTASLTNRMIRPGISVSFLTVVAGKRQQNGSSRYVNYLRSGRIELMVCYCSVFDECWSLRSEGQGRPEAVAQCPTALEGPAL